MSEVDQLPTQPTIHQLMSRVMADIGAVGKDDRNDQQNYSFRGIDRVMNAVHAAMTNHGVIVTPEVLSKEFSGYKTRNGAEMRVAVMTVRYTFWGPAGDSVKVVTVGEASDSADKATNKALSAAMKYALLHTFVVPTEDVVREDADRETPERGTQVVSLAKYITQELNKAEREALREAWTAEYDFKTSAVPYSKERECVRLIDSYVGTFPEVDEPASQPEPEAKTDAPAEASTVVDLSELVGLLTQTQRKTLQENWTFEFTTSAVPRSNELEVRELMESVRAGKAS